MTERPSSVTTHALVRESLRNIRSFLARTLVLSSTAAACGFLVVSATVGEVDGIVAAYRSQVDRGVETISVTTGDGGGISAMQCDAARTIDGVITAGGVVGSTQIRPSQVPTSPISILTVTPGFAAVIFPHETHAATAGILAASEITQELGIVPGSTLTYRSDPRGNGDLGTHLLTVDNVATTTALTSGSNRDIFIMVPPKGGVRECLVQAAPGKQDTVIAALAGWFTGEKILVQGFLNPDQLEIDPAEKLANRWSSSSWLFAGAFLNLLNGFMWWSRRRDTALYRLLRFRRRHVGCMIAIESLLVSIVPAQLGATAALIISRPAGGLTTLAAVTVDDLRLVLILVFIPLIGVAVSRTRSSIDALKGR